MGIPDYNFINSAGEINTPEIVEELDEDNQLLHVYASGQSPNEFTNFESINIPLPYPIEPGCTVVISFDAACISLNPNPIGQPTLQFYALTNAPCTLIQYPESCVSGLIPFCTGVDGACMTNQSFPNNEQGILLNEDTDAIHQGPPGFETLNLDLESFMFTWENQTNSTFTHILLFTGSGNENQVQDDIFVDNIEIFSSCESDIQITSTVTDACIGEVANLT